MNRKIAGSFASSNPVSIKRILILILGLSVLLQCFVVSAQNSVADVLNPKTEGGGYVSNVAHIIHDTTVVQLNGLLEKLDKQGKGQVAVVLVNSIVSQVPKEFATALFRHWGIGNRKTNNGLLILVVKDQRRIEFEVGYGLEGILTDASCNHIQQRLMRPYFRVGNYDQGVLEGVKVVAAALTAETDPASVPEYAEILKPKYTGGVVFLNILVFIGNILVFSLYSSSYNGRKIVQDTSWLWMPFLWFGPLVSIVLIGAFTSIFQSYDILLIQFYCTWSVFFTSYFLSKVYRELPDASRLEKYQYLTSVLHQMSIYIVLFPLPFLLIQFLLLKIRLYRLRYAPYYFGSDGEEMKRVTIQKKELLTASEQLEERIGSVTYDLWKSSQTGQLMKIGYNHLLTKICKCKKCGAMTAQEVNRIINQKASVNGEGSGIVNYKCQCCGATQFAKFRINKKFGFTLSAFFTFWKGAGSNLGKNSNGSSNSDSSFSNGSSGSSGYSESSGSSDWSGGSSGGGGSGSDW